MIVPVRNREASLAHQVAHLLDLLPDLTPHFEIVLVDDASTDLTIDVAADLARQFPQLRLIRHREPRGLKTAAKTGVEWATGQTIFVLDETVRPSAGDLRRLWSLRHDRAASGGKSQAPGVLDPSLLKRLATWGQSLRSTATARTRGGLQMVRRSDAASLKNRRNDAASVAVAPSAPKSLGRTDASHLPEKPRQARNFLRHLRDVTIGD